MNFLGKIILFVSVKIDPQMRLLQILSYVLILEIRQKNLYMKKKPITKNIFELETRNAKN